LLLFSLLPSLATAQQRIALLIATRATPQKLNGYRTPLTGNAGNHVAHRLARHAESAIGHLFWTEAQVAAIAAMTGDVDPNLV